MLIVLQLSCVGAAQRFNQGSALKRTIFELIAQELLLTLVPDPSLHGAAPASVDMCVSIMRVPLQCTSPL